MKTFYLVRPIYDKGRITTVEVCWIANNRKQLALISHRQHGMLLIDDFIMSYFLTDNSVRLDWSNINKEEIF